MGMDEVGRGGSGHSEGLARIARRAAGSDGLARRGGPAHDRSRRGPRFTAISGFRRGRAIEFEISWKKKPDFVFALGTSDQPESVKRAFRFEAWGGDLIVQRELEKEADLAVVQEIGSGPGRAHFQVYLDQENNKITIFSPLGKQLASLKVGGSKSPRLFRSGPDESSR